MARIGNLIRDPANIQKLGKEIDTLATMPERVTKDDLRKIAKALNDCAEDIAYLLKGTLVGCPCRVIEDDHYTRVIYEEKCAHHGRLLTECERHKKYYEEAEQKLKANVRQAIAIAALPGLISADNPMQPSREVAKRALDLADSLVAELLR